MRTLILTLLEFLNNWDIDEDTIREIFSKEIKIEIGDKLYSQEIALNKKLADQVSLFDSEYFSAFLKLLELQPNNDLKRIITAFRVAFRSFRTKPCISIER